MAVSDFSWFFYRIGIFISLVFPRRFAYAVSSVLSSFWCFFSSADRNAVVENLKIVLKTDNPKILMSSARMVFVNFGKNLVDFFRFSKMDDLFLRKNIRIHNAQGLSNCLEEFSGVIILTAHLGNNELGGAVLSSLGYRFHAVYLQHRDSRTDVFFNKQRALFNTGVIPLAGASTLKKCFTVLKGKGVLALAGDKDYTGNGVTVDFLGARTVVPKGPARLSVRLGVPIIPAFMIREKDDTFSLRFETPIYPVDDSGSPRDEDTLISEGMRVIGRYVERYPEQWYIFSPYFVT